MLVSKFLSGKYRGINAKTMTMANARTASISRHIASRGQILLKRETDKMKSHEKISAIPFWNALAR